MNILIKNSGLKPTQDDPLDYHYQKTFGSALVILPDEYIVGSVAVKNQLGSMFCTAFAAYVLAALEDGEDFSPEWFFSKEKEIEGSPLNEGCDLRTSCKAAVQYGFLLQEMAQFSVLTKDPMFLADSANWPFSNDLAAASYKKKSYFRVDGNFQEVKQILYQNQDQKRAIITGINWYNEFTYSPNGIVPSNYNELGGGHCIAIIGFKKINGTEYMVIQNSYGTEIGDKGYFYFNEEVFNKEFTMPMFMFVDIDNTVIPKRLGTCTQVLTQKLLCLLGLR